MGGRCGALLILVAFAGCAAAPVPAARVVDTVQPSADPYAVDAGPSDTKRVTRTVERVPEWSDARHVRSIEAFMASATGSPADLVSFTEAGVTVTGTASQVDAVAKFLADRVAFREARIQLSTSFIRVPGGELPKLLTLESSPLGFGWTVLPPYVLKPLLERHRSGDVEEPRVVAFDAQESTVFVGDLLASKFKRSARAGFTLNTSGVLSDDGSLLVVRVRSEVSSLPASADPESSENWLRVPVQKDSHVALPRLRQVCVEGNYRLRHGESLLLVVDDPNGGDAVMIVLSWSKLP